MCTAFQSQRLRGLLSCYVHTQVIIPHFICHSCTCTATDIYTCIASCCCCGGGEGRRKGVESMDCYWKPQCPCTNRESNILIMDRSSPATTCLIRTRNVMWKSEYVVEELIVLAVVLRSRHIDIQYHWRIHFIAQLHTPEMYK